MLDSLLFVGLPYVALALAVAGGCYRYFNVRFSYSTLSSQFLENRGLFWGSTPWHYGIVIILTAHLLAALFPTAWGRLMGNPARLYFLEVTGIGLALFTLWGLLTLIVRRWTNSRIRVVSTAMDWILLAALAIQVGLGIYIAVVHRWGSIWFLHTAVPWLWSLFTFQPDPSRIATLPWTVKVHFINAFVLVGLFPFTRLVHIFTVPIPYLWRPYQVVVWNRRPTPPKDKRVTEGALR